MDKDITYVGKVSDKKPIPDIKDRWKDSRLFKMFASLVSVEQPLFNMPKNQRCPKCMANSHREEITTNGANYKCRNHGSFFVRHIIYEKKSKGGQHERVRS